VQLGGKDYVSDLSVLGLNPSFHTFFDQLSAPDGVEVPDPCGGGARVAGPCGRRLGW
jgi:hypothetical protein